jgi:hypothetical protein
VCDEVVGEVWEELPGGLLVGVDVEGGEDLHARVLDHGEEVLLQPIVWEEFSTYPLRVQYGERVDPLVVLIEGTIQSVSLNTRALGHLLRDLGSDISTTPKHISEIYCITKFQQKIVGIRFLWCQQTVGSAR